MMLYIVRHGDPDYEHNTITPHGHKEAAALAQWFRDIPLDEIYTSPLGRAINTAAYTCDVKGLAPSVLPWTEESMDYMERISPLHPFGYRMSEEHGITDIEDSYPARADTIARLIRESDAFFAEKGYVREGAHYRVTAHNEQHIAIFCHGGFGTALTAHLLGLPPALGFQSMFMTTSSVTTFEWSDPFKDGITRPRMLRFGEITHLDRQGLTSNR